MLDFIHPNLLALIAAVLIAGARSLYRAGLARLSPVVTNLVMTAVVTVSAAAFYQLEPGPARWPGTGVAWFVASGVFGAFAGRYLSLVSITLVGLARTSVVMQTSLVWSALFAVGFVGERMTPLLGTGTLAIMLGTALLAREGEAARARIPLRRYLVPLLAASLYGMVHMASKFGLRALPSAPFGMGVAAAAGFVLMLGVLPFSEGGRDPGGWDRGALATVAAGAALNALSTWFFWSAMKNGELVTVIPINRLSVLLVIFFSWLFFRKQEAVTRRVVAGGLLAVAGAFAVAWAK